MKSPDTAAVAETQATELTDLPIETEVAVRFQSGDPTIYSELYSRFHTSISAFIRQQVRNAEVAEDIAQEVFLKVFRFCSLYNPEQAFETWVRAIARNTILDWHRKQKSSRLELGTEEAFEVEAVPCKRPNAEKLLVFRSRWETLKPLLRKLTGLQRRVVFQRVVRNLSYDEIARKLGLSVSSVKSAMYRAKLVLAEGV